MRGAHEKRLYWWHGAACDRQEHHTERKDGVGEEGVHVAVHAVAKTDGRVADERLVAVAAHARRRQHAGVGKVVHAWHHAHQWC